MGKSGWRSQEEKIRAGIMKMEARHVLNINPWCEGGRGGVKGVWVIRDGGIWSMAVCSSKLSILLICYLIS